MSNLESDKEDQILEILREIRRNGEKISDILDHQSKQLTDIKQGVEHTNDTIENANLGIKKIRTNDVRIPIVIGTATVAGSITGAFFGPVGSAVGAIIGLSVASLGYVLKK